jgi:hypothetical protein
MAGNLFLSRWGTPNAAWCAGILTVATVAAVSSAATVSFSSPSLFGARRVFVCPGGHLF